MAALRRRGALAGGRRPPNEGLCMKISIITPVFNEPRVGRALDSVLGQRHGHELETILIDGGSNQETRDILAHYRQRLSVVVSEPDAGPYDGMNKGIDRATGDVIGILNADDRYGDDAVLADVMDVFQREPGVQVCYGDIAYLDDHGKFVRYWKSGPHRQFKWWLGWRPPHPAFFARRQVYERYGLFDLDFAIASDYEMQLRLLLKHGVRSAYMDRVLVHMAPGGLSNGSLGNVVKANLEASRAWSRNHLQGGQLVPLLKPLLKIPQFVRPPFARGLLNGGTRTFG